jgi:hypothetical protein
MGLLERLGEALTAQRDPAAERRLTGHRGVAQPYLDRIPLDPRSNVIGPEIGYAILRPQSATWFQAMMGAPPADRIALGIAVLDAIAGQRGSVLAWIIGPELLKGLGRSIPAHEPADRVLVVRLAIRATTSARFVRPAQYAAAVIERCLKEGTPVVDVEPDIHALVGAMAAAGISASEVGPVRAKLLGHLGPGTEGVDERALFDDGDTWGVAMREHLRADAGARSQGALLLHLATATSVKPSGRWVTDARRLLGTDVAEALVQHMIEASFDAQLLRGAWAGMDDVSPFHPTNAPIVRGAYWAAFAGGWPWVTGTLGRAGLHWALSGRDDNYPRDQRLATTCATLLGEIDAPEALTALGRIDAKVRNRTVAKTVKAALDRAAERAGTTPSELLELAVSPMGLGADGRREVALDGGVGVLSVDPTDGASLHWRVDGGQETDDPPRALIAADKTGVAAARSELKELRKALAAERGRIEDLFVEEREWSLGAWVERYLRHPLTAPLTRRLIWRFGSGDAWFSGMPLDDAIHAADGSARTPAAETRVRLWHPIDVSADEVRAWRSFLLERRIRQPFKQAFREVYLIAPAEEATATYSNRFAGHILDYPVARALMGARRWQSNFLGPFDGGFDGTAKREFRSRSLRAEFYHEAIEEEGDQGRVAHCSTDQVRFLPLASRGGDEPIPLPDIAPVVFSETMRDVDLFVSVSTIAADENWQDAGADRHAGRAMAAFGAYWHDQSFGELGPTATSRREVLAWILPQLAIADRLAIDDRWLHVRGELRSYKIHLGSANIVMEPDDQYLCIVPARDPGRQPSLFLPFDDDQRLTVILSKAQLLAHDSAIKDPSITRQLQRR